jgi:hypothetical protein
MKGNENNAEWGMQNAEWQGEIPHSAIRIPNLI